MEKKRQARRLGFSFAAFLLAVVLSQLVFSVLIEQFFPQIIGKPWFLYLVSALPNYLVGMPLFFYLTRRIPDSPRERGESFTPGTIIRYAIIGVAISYLFAILGDLLNAPFVEGFDMDENVLENLIRNSDFVSTLIFVVILAPLMEELLFRRRFLTKALQFGKGNAVLAGGLAFGLFHLNIPQMVYATALGTFWGMVYVRHRSFPLVVILHMITNAIGSVLMPFLAFDVAGGEIIGGVFILSMIVLGLVLLFIERRGFYRAMQEEPGEEKQPSLVFNLGYFTYVMIVVAVFLLAIMGTSILSEELISGIMSSG